MADLTTNSSILLSNAYKAEACLEAALVPKPTNNKCKNNCPTFNKSSSKPPQSAAQSKLDKLCT